MKAAMCRRYGPPSSVTIEEVAQPLPALEKFWWPLRLPG